MINISFSNSECLLWELNDRFQLQSIRDICLLFNTTVSSILITGSEIEVLDSFTNTKHKENKITLTDNINIYSFLLHLESYSSKGKIR